MFVGLAFAVIISNINYTEILKRWYVAAVVGIIPVVLTFFIGFAPNGTDDKAWLILPGNISFQPAELLKICFIITFSAHLGAVKKDINKFKVLIPAVLHGAFPVMLIHVQGDDGTALVFAVMFVSMLFSAGLKLRYFIIVGVAALISAPLIYFFVMNPDQQLRVLTIFNLEADLQGAGYQQWQARIALANGGVTGQGLFRGELTQAGIVPESYNDFIFVSIGEELGLLGCLTVVILIAAICLRCIQVGKISNSDSGMFISVGIFAMLAAQSIINIGMCISVLPVIGVTLPFFSAGGTSLLCLMLGIGLMLSVYMHQNSRIIYLHS
jgi:rod shape determining protein RodA